MQIAKNRSRLEIWVLFGGSALLLLAGILLALQFVQPAPPESIRIASGSSDGAYYRYAELYSRLLAEHGIGLEAASKVHGDGSLFAPAGTFPTPDHGDFPLHSDAERHYKYGPPLLQRYLPFWLATWIDRTKVMLLPLLVLLLPLLRTLPPVYRWRIRRRILRWYVELRRIDLDLEGDTPDSARLAELARQLEGIESEAARVQVPLAYSDALYNLRLHIGLLEDKIARLRTASTTAGA